MVSRLFAALLVVLAAVPFTAPFASYDLAELTTNVAFHHGNCCNDKLSDKASAHDLIFTVVVAPCSGVLFEAAGLMSNADGRQALPFVLRL